MPVPRLQLVRLLVVAAAAMASAAACAKDPVDPAPSKDADPFPITVRAAPTMVMAARAVGASDSALTISGNTLPNGQREVAITIMSEAGAVTGTHRVRPDAKGRYSYAAPAPALSGNYRIAVVAPDGRGKAFASFKAIDGSVLGLQAETVINDALVAAQDGVNAAEAKIDALTESPAKSQAKQQIADAERGLGELRAAAIGNAVKGIIGAIASDAALQESLRARLDGSSASLEDIASQTERVRALTATMSSADVGCHQLAVVGELFRGIAVLLGAKAKVLLAAGGLAKDFMDASYARRSKVPAPASPDDSPSRVKQYGAEVELATKTIGGPAKLLTGLSAYITGKLFGSYCEQFVGPLEAIMNARFFTSSTAVNPLAEWWSYNYQLTGRVILYYPKGAKGGTPVRLYGRIEGYAHGFKTWEDALTVTFPKLMAGTLQHKFNYPPIEAGMVPSPEGKTAPGSDYSNSAATSLAIPNSFLINVTGVLEQDAVTIMLGTAQSDINATHRVAAVILAPLVGGLGPQVTWYPLGFQKVRPFLVNAADGESMRLTLKAQGGTMLAQGVFSGKVDKPTVKAEYTLKIKACNPGC